MHDFVVLPTPLTLEEKVHDDGWEVWQGVVLLDRRFSIRAVYNPAPPVGFKNEALRRFRQAGWRMLDTRTFP